MKKDKETRPALWRPVGFDSWSPEAQIEFYRLSSHLPIRKAYNKFFDFVGECVRDPDFGHEDCTVFLQFLVGVRDSLVDGITEDWDMDDILHPIIEDLRPVLQAEGTQDALDQKNQRLRKAKSHAIQAWLSKPRKRGEKESFCMEIQGEVSRIAERKQGNPIAVKTIRDNWLSDDSVKEWRQESKT